MNNIPNQGYVKEIIKEYNERLHSWGHSDTWNLTQFKTLANMLNEATNININAATLKRFFQQHTGNPQMATKEALCIYLGYKGYTDFVMRKEAELQKKSPAGPDSTSPSEGNDTAVTARDISHTTDKVEPTDTVTNTRTGNASFPISSKPTTGMENISLAQEYIRHHQKSRKYLAALVLATLIILGISAYQYWLKDVYIEYLLAKIEFSVSPQSGNSPLTVSFSYDIPEKLMKDITIGYIEANGDITERRLPENIHSVNTTFIYEGEGYAYLKYKDREIKRLAVKSHNPGWSVSVRDERRNFYKTYPIDEVVKDKGYISLPFDSIPMDARTNHMFVTYTYFKENLIDGDNFVLEANVRNSPEEHAIPCSDIIMYIGSDSATHGFAMNEQGNAFIKFISGENEMKGDTHSFNQHNFSAATWQVMKIAVEGGDSKFYIDGKLIHEMQYKQPVGTINQLIFRFKGCGAVDWVRLSKPDGRIIFEETFNGQP